MAKRKSVADLGEAGDNYSDMRDELQAAATKQLQAHHGHVTPMSHQESVWRCGGVALPALCLRWALHQEAFALGRTWTLSGLFGSNKTSLSFEFMRWVLCYRGLGWYEDVEKKDSPGMREASMRYNQEYLDSIEVIQCNSQDVWQSAITAQVDQLTAITKKYGGKMRLLGCSIADSVAAANPQAEVDAFITKRGGAGFRGFASMALYNSKWLENIVHRVSAVPFVLILIQHSAEKFDPITGMSAGRTQKGGMEVGFAKTTAFELTKRGQLKETANGGGVTIQIDCTKNALGPAKRRFDVPVRWFWEPIPGEPDKRRQVYYWDWHHATIDLLLKFNAVRKSTWNAIKEVCDLHEESRKRVWSHALGIPKSDPVPWSVAGEILEYEHPELLPPLYNILHIERRPVMKVGGDLLDLWEGRVGVQDVPDPPPYPRMVAPVSEEDDE